MSATDASHSSAYIIIRVHTYVRTYVHREREILAAVQPAKVLPHYVRTRTGTTLLCNDSMHLKANERAVDDRVSAMCTRIVETRYLLTTSITR